MPRVPRTRSPYWQVGMSFVEPWAAVCQTNTGMVVARTGMNAAAAIARSELWRSLHRQGLPLSPHQWSAGGMVVDPVGNALSSWGDPVVPGQSSRWVPIMMLRRPEPLSCLACQTVRTAGCWLAVDAYGCSRCLPAEEAHDPRAWPSEPDAPGRERPKVKPKASGRRRSMVRTVELASPGQGRLL